MNTIWDDLDHLSDDGLMLYVWSWTNTKCGMAGVYKVARRKLVEGRFEDGRLDTALTELESEGLLRYVQGVLWNCARVKRLSMISDNIAKSIAKDLAEIDQANPIVTEFVDRYGRHPKLEGRLSLVRPSGEPQENAPIEPKVRGSAEGRQTLPGRGRGRASGAVAVAKNLQPLFSHLERVAFSRNLQSPKVETVSKACKEFADRDLAVEADKFAHYWIDGAGENRQMRDVAGTWRNWLRNAPSAGKTRSGPARTQPATVDRSKYDAKTTEVPA